MKIELLTDHTTNVIQPVDMESMKILPLQGWLDDLSYINSKGKLLFATGVKDLHNKLLIEANKYVEGK